MRSTTRADGVYALLVDGQTVYLRQTAGADRPQLLDLHARLSERSLFLRFFSISPHAVERYVDKLTGPHGPNGLSLLAELGGKAIGVAAYVRLPGTSTAEVAFVVADEFQGMGVGTLLLEHLASAALEQGITSFEAETLVTNSEMLDVFHHAGHDLRTHSDNEVVRVEFPLRETERLREAVERRESRAAYASLQPIMAPTSIVVAGAGRSPSGLGHQLLRHLVEGSFTGDLYAVNRTASPVAGVAGYRSVREVPAPVDLAVAVVPAEQVLAVARDCAEHGVRGLVVVSAGFAESSSADAQNELLTICRSAGMRLVGPNCLGVLNAAPKVAMNATLSHLHPPAGSIGLASQSGAVGIAALAHAVRNDIGIATFASLGNKADVSGNDMLMYWEHDDTTRVCALYLESFGNPRKFSRIAQRLGRHKPVVAITAGRSSAGERGARSHTAAAATPALAVDALFHQSGVVHARSLAELLDVVSLLDLAPLPTGRRLAILGNSGGPGVLAADAAEAAGLDVPELPAGVRADLAALLPSGAATANPVDLMASADPDTLEQILRRLLREESVDAALVVYTALQEGGSDAVAEAVRRVVQDRPGKPVLAAFLGLNEVPEATKDSTGRPLYPVFPWPEDAVASLAAVAEYAEWRRRPPHPPAQVGGTDASFARVQVARVLRQTPGGRWLDGDEAVRLVQSYGIACLPTTWVADAEEAAGVADKIGGPVALKAAAGDLVHKTELAAVRVNIDPADVAREFTEMAYRVGPQMGGALVQPMAGEGVEAALGIVHDPSFGPLVMVGLGGVTSDLAADRSFCLTPLTREDAAEHVRSLRGAPLLFGYRGSPRRNVQALEDMLIRVARLADDVPEIAEMDINPVLVGVDSAVAVDVKIRLAPFRGGHPLRRQLPS